MTPKLTRIPSDVAALADYVPLARQLLDDNAWTYMASGAGDGLTQRWNREAFDCVRLTSRTLTPFAGGHTGVELLGLDLAHPLILAPVAYQKLFHPDGERGSAKAAAATDALYVAATLASATLEDIAEAGQGAPQWFQLYLQPDPGVTRLLVERAESAGYRALVVTVDAPISGLRNAEQRIGFQLPDAVRAENLVGVRQSISTRSTGGHPLFDGFLANAPTWRDIERLRALTRLPIVIKGVLSPEDARQALACGADALVVSNHGGRTLDTLEASLDALPRVADAVGSAAPLLLDGGVRRGTDVLKALALGARAVMIGRAYAFALAAAGPLGVAHAMKVLAEEFALAMALTGCRTPADIGPDRLADPRLAIGRVRP